MVKKELTVCREGAKLILEPVWKNWLTLNDDSEPVGGDLVENR